MQESINDNEQGERHKKKPILGGTIMSKVSWISAPYRKGSVLGLPLFRPISLLS